MQKREMFSGFVVYNHRLSKKLPTIITEYKVNE